MPSSNEVGKSTDGSARCATETRVKGAEESGSTMVALSPNTPRSADMTAVVTGGKGSGMPAFESKLEPAEIDAVVRYVREVLN